MPKKSEETFEFLKRREFAKVYPARAKVLNDKVLSKYVSWVLIDRSSVPSGKTYLLMASSAYKKACFRFEPMTENFAYDARFATLAPLRELQAEIENCRAIIFNQEDELRAFRERLTAFDENQVLLNQEIKAVRILKEKLQRLIENLKIGDSPIYAALRGFFARVDELALNKFTKEAWKKTHRRPKAPTAATRS